MECLFRFHLNDASGKADGAYGTWKPRGCHSVVSGILYANERPSLQWVLKNIPIALEEAADIDGASTWTTYWKVVFPMMMPMHATVAILTALGTWNDVMTPLVIMSGTGQNTLPLAQLNFQTQFGTNYNLAFASYIMALIPILIFYVICQKQILNGVANGAVKG